jgi:3-oxoacyl-ACP reductase-like protein
MGIFGSILSKLGLGDEDKDKAPTRPAGTPTAGAPAAPRAPAAPAATAAPAAPAAPVAVPVVDVEAHMERLAAKVGHEVNWRHSIVDLLSLLDIDNSYAARKELAIELGCPPELMEDSAKMNMWLHKTVLARIAANGGKVPQSLLD